MHGFKKTKNQWSKKNKKRKFDDEFSEGNSKKTKKNKSYYRIQNDMNDYEEYI